VDNPFNTYYPDHIDTELINLAVSGDKQALQNLILRHQIFVYNLALKMSRNRHDADDLTQEVFIKAITSLTRFEGKNCL
jgi:DNA-directed RNA polymerase specialized sigma24 family protein